MTTPAGWYDDPSNPGGQRWWDGEQWTEHVVAPTEAVDAVPDTDAEAQAAAAEPEPPIEPILDPTMPFETPAAPGPPPGLISADQAEVIEPPAPARGGRILLAVAAVIVLVAAMAGALLFLGGDEGTVTPETVPVDEPTPPAQAPSTSAPPPTESSTTTADATTPERTPEEEAARSELLDELMTEPSALTEAQALCVVDALESAGLGFEIDGADVTEADVELLSELILGCVADNE